MANTNKIKLSRRVAAKSGLPACKVRKVIDQIIESFAEYLKAGDTIEIRGLGTFRAKTRRVSLTPGTAGASSSVQKLRVSFRAGKKLKEKINA